ncbi:gasdermin-D isoform X2 [Elephas maximus indicus]|uniref:gasdermin-D isoform X2 n=1 Tax=Elephas maximus indicus TaxID=99487 RepID=UPI0021164AD0|nr:gasdermin-D isoform X2 [Elephas maximus indicus]
MPSSFSGVVRSVVRELDRTGELIPVDSLRSSTSFQPYCLVSRKPSTSWFWRSRYTSVNLSIRDILEPNAPEPGVQCRGPFHFHDTMDGRVQGSVELAAPGQGRIKGGATVSGSSSASMDVFTLRVDPSTWETLHKERRLRQPEHKILQQLRNRGDNVYVVTEALQTQKEVEVTRTHKQEGSGQFALPGVTCLQGEGQGHLSRKKTVTIPSGSILAFQVAKLVIGPDWDILLLPDKKQRTFQKPPADGPTEERAAVTKDFAGLRAEVEPQAQELENLSKELRQEMLGALGRLLLDTPALQDLEEALEQGLCCGRVEPRDGPVGTVLECLVLPSQELVKDLAIPVFYLLGALTALSETQHLLVAQALETRALPRQLELVGSVLKQSSPWQEPRAVSLPPGLLGSSWGEDAPAWVLLEECGLELQVGPPRACWDPEAQGHTCALYAALALLLRLGQEPC